MSFFSISLTKQTEHKYNKCHLSCLIIRSSTTFGNSLEPLAAPPMRYTTSRHSTIQTFTCCHYLRQILENNYPSVNMSVCLVKSSFMLLYLHSVAVRRSTDRYGSVIFPSGHAKKRCTRSTRFMFCFPVQLSP